MGLSSNIFWHETSKKGLKGIIKEKGFFLSYSQEKIGSGELAFPMLSMCDLPFAELGSYLGKYGDYLIGMKRSWGEAKKFTPVIYINKSSNLMKAYKELLGDANSNKKRMLEITSYIKHIEGPLEKRKIKNYRFYDEREVRFVPKVDDRDLKVKPVLLPDGYEKYKSANKGSSLIKTYKVNFEWSDVKYIIVLNDKNIEECKSWCNDEDFKKVPIFTRQQVIDDFIGEFHQVEEGDIVELDLNDLKKALYSELSKYFGPK